MVERSWANSPTPPNIVKAKRKRHDPGFKARVALEAIRGIKTVQQIAVEFDVHPVQVSEWKKRLSTQAGSVFDKGKEAPMEDFEAERTELHSKIGELTVRLDFVVKKSRQLGVWSGLPNSSSHTTRS
jgi:transposase